MHTPNKDYAACIVELSIASASNWESDSIGNRIGNRIRLGIGLGIGFDWESVWESDTINACSHQRLRYLLHQFQHREDYQSETLNPALVESVD